MRAPRTTLSVSRSPEAAIALVALLAVTAHAQTPTARPKIPAWIVQAREAMQVRSAFGIAFVMPERAERPTDQRELRRHNERYAAVSARMHERLRALFPVGGVKGAAMWYYGGANESELRAIALQTLLMTEDVDVRELLLDSVLLCGTAAQVGARDGESLVLFDPLGRRVVGAQVDLADERAVVATMRTLLRDGRRLQERAVRARESKQVVRALGDLTSRDGARRRDARRFLVDNFARVSAAVAGARTTAEGAEKKALDEVVGAAWADATGDDGTGMLPFGMEWVERRGDPCPPCGMARVPGPSRKFLSFLPR